MGGPEPPPNGNNGNGHHKRSYEVIHRLMIEADSPVDAAIASLVMVQNGEDFALTYEVKLGKKKKVTVDLSTDPPTVL